MQGMSAKNPDIPRAGWGGAEHGGPGRAGRGEASWGMAKCIRVGEARGGRGTAAWGGSAMGEATFHFDTQNHECNHPGRFFGSANIKKYYVNRTKEHDERSTTGSLQGTIAARHSWLQTCGPMLFCFCFMQGVSGNDLIHLVPPHRRPGQLSSAVWKSKGEVGWLSNQSKSRPQISVRRSVQESCLRQIKHDGGGLCSHRMN